MRYTRQLAAAVAAVLIGLWPAPAAARQARLARLAVDTTAAVDETTDLDGNRTTGVILDAVVSAGLGSGVELIVRPFVQRLASGEWNRQVWIAALRYERRGPVNLRVDAGLIPSPIGLANLTLRPPLNPTIAQPSSLFTPLPPLEPRGARATLLGAVYPYGAQATVSGARWDARAAIMDTSPLRTRRVFAATNPPRFANVVIGGGVTPRTGLRIGGSVARGLWQRSGETPVTSASRDATVATVEAEYQVRYTKLAGEWTRDRLDTSTGPRVASGWFVQAQQALAPRWFVAGRVERIEAPAVFWLDGAAQAPMVSRQTLEGYESVVGFRATPAVTLRAAHRARMGFGRDTFTQTFSVSLVWWQRWL